MYRATHTCIIANTRTLNSNTLQPTQHGGSQAPYIPRPMNGPNLSYSYLVAMGYDITKPHASRRDGLYNLDVAARGSHNRETRAATLTMSDTNNGRHATLIKIEIWWTTMYK